jgi:crotonobetainyl-CoA:carnitine CoA-transferase CaiB-like acyl-CoA transferase
MTKPLQGIKVVEVAMWAFVPVAGAILSDMGAEVIKVEPPTGDPIRGLQIGGTEISGQRQLDFSWESYNRGKRSITLDLKQEAGRAVLMKLLANADVLLTNLLPPARMAMGIDEAAIRARFPNLIYATGSAVGQNGPESDKGGFDAITFWARGGVSSSMTEPDADHPVGPPGPAFGDSLSGSMLAGGVCAAIAKRALTGEASSVDVSLLSAAMWAMQRYTAQATDLGIERFPRPPADLPNNVLVNNYKTRDGRFVALCMLQADKYWGKLCEVAGRPDLGADPRYSDALARKANLAACLADVKSMFASRTLAEWREILARQDGQWDVVQHVGELKDDAQVQANAYIQRVDYGDGTTIPLVSAPMQFDGAALLSQRSPELGDSSDAILESLGYDEDGIIDLKVQGVVF